MNRVNGGWPARLFFTACAACLAFMLQRGARRRGYPAWSECRCVFRTEPIFHIVLWGVHAPEADTLLVLSVVRPPALLRRALHHGAQCCAVLHDAVRGGHAPYVVRVDIQGATRTHVWLSLFGGGQVPDAMRPGIRRLRLEQGGTAGPGQTEAILRVFREPRSGRILLKNCCASRSPAGTRVDCIGPVPSQISYCTARLPHRPAPSPMHRERPGTRYSGERSSGSNAAASPEV